MPPTLPRRHLLLALATVACGSALPLLPGCAGIGMPRAITLSEAELSARLARAFPLQQRVLEVLDLQLDVPQLRLLPDRGRLAVVLRLQAQERLSGSAGLGELAFDSGLRFEPADATLRLTQVRVQRIEFWPGTDARHGGSPPDAMGALSDRVQRFARLPAERLLDDLVVYRVGAERLARLRQLGLQPGTVTVTHRGVEITLDARKD